jgi:hypothetical protein
LKAESATRRLQSSSSGSMLPERYLQGAPQRNAPDVK